MAASEHFLVTGALGCIGAWIVHRLVQEGVPVVAFDADTDVRRLRLLMDDAQLSRVTFVNGDITIWPCLRTRWTSTASQMSFTWAAGAASAIQERPAAWRPRQCAGRREYL